VRRGPINVTLVGYKSKSDTVVTMINDTYSQPSISRSLILTELFLWALEEYKSRGLRRRLNRRYFNKSVSDILLSDKISKNTSLYGEKVTI
jgi:aspartate/tyrosine/aromatic aminotransferase